MFPTIKTLKQHAPFGSASEILEWASGREVVPIEPQVVMEGEVARVVLPGRAGLRGMSEELSRETVAVHAGRPSEGPLSPPVVLASNYRTYGYSREEGSPMWEAFEAAIGALEGGESVAFGSGMAAIAAVLEPLPVGARVVGPAIGYTVTRGLLAERAAAGRLELESVDLADTEAVLAAREGATLLWVESRPTCLSASPSSTGGEGATPPARRSWSTRRSPPRCCCARSNRRRCRRAQRDEVHRRPLRSAPRGGQRADDRAGPALRHTRAMLGATPGALEAFLALRGLRTMGVRLERGQARAAVLAERLAAHPAVSAVHYPGLPSDPGHERAAQADGRLRRDARVRDGGGRRRRRCGLRPRPGAHPRDEPRRGGDPDRASLDATRTRSRPTRSCASAWGSRTSRTCGATWNGRCPADDRVHGPRGSSGLDRGCRAVHAGGEQCWRHGPLSAGAVLRRETAPRSRGGRGRGRFRTQVPGASASTR